MSEDPQRIDPVAAEHLMRGARSGSPDPEPLAHLLAAAAAPARQDELAGEEAAVAAFQRARLALAPDPRRRFMLRSVLVKAAVAASVAVVGGGGVALAASTGRLHTTHSPDHHALARPATSATATPRPSRHAARPATTSTHRTRTASHDPEPSGSPSPNLRGLCRAFRAHAGDNPGKSLDNRAFTVLIRKAGGRDKVAAYCDALLATRTAKPSARRSDASTHPTSHPTHSKSTPSHPAPSTSKTHIP